MTARGAFWTGLATILYTYVGFPLLVVLRSMWRPEPCDWRAHAPSVSLVVAAHNEEGVIRRKLENLLALDYEPGALEILVASDGSDDRTNDIVGKFSDRGIRLLALPRVGKAAALNRAVAIAAGDILVFSDANSIYAADAIRQLVLPFSDPAVGGVAGDQRYLARAADGTASGERRYWDLDRLLKRAESRGGNAISATGAIYAIRRELFDPVPEGVTDDFFVSTGVIAQGRRLVFQESAVAYEPVAATSKLELDRKVRVITRGLRGVLTRRQLLDPRRYGFYALQLASHKVLRRIMVVPLAVVAAVSPSLWRRGLLYRLATCAQALLYGAGAVGLVLQRSMHQPPRLFRASAYFCLVNYACVRALINLARGQTIARWEPQRSEACGHVPSGALPSPLDSGYRR